KFALAWGQLCYLHSWLFLNSLDRSEARRTKATAARDTVIRLVPESPEAIRAQGDFAYYVQRAYDEAIGHYTRLSRLQPNNPDTIFQVSAVLQRQWKL